MVRSVALQPALLLQLMLTMMMTLTSHVDALTQVITECQPNTVSQQLLSSRVYVF